MKRFWTVKRIAPFVVVLLFWGVATLHSWWSRAPEAHYKAFAEDMLNRQYDSAAAMTVGLDAKQLAKLGTQERIGDGPAMFQMLFPSEFAIDARDRGDDGSVTLHATQTVLFNPVGVESALRPAMYAKMRQVATLKKSGGVWKIVSFDNTFLEMDSTSGK